MKALFLNKHMQNIKTISFDLWNTLISGNPRFKKERSKYIQSFTDASLEEIDQAFKKVKKDLDHAVEKFGVSFDPIDVYSKVLMILKIDTNHLKEIKYRCEQLFMEFPPHLIPYTKEKLRKLSEKYELVISSNTMFVPGNVLRSILELLDIDKYFHHMFFSNELGVSKPHIEFFKHIHTKSIGLIDEIIHVGDDTITDISGAANYGFQVYEFSDLYNHNIKSFYAILEWKKLFNEKRS